MPHRNAKGRFVKTSHRSHRSHSRRSTSTAIVRRSPQTIVVRTPSTVTHRRGGRRRHHGGGGLSGSRAPLKIKAELAGWASVLGYLETQKSDTFDKIPSVGKLPKAAVVGIVLHLVGRKNKHLDRASAAALTVAGYKIGAAGYQLSGDD